MWRSAPGSRAAIAVPPKVSTRKGPADYTSPGFIRGSARRLGDNYFHDSHFGACQLAPGGRCPCLAAWRRRTNGRSRLPCDRCPAAIPAARLDPRTPVAPGAPTPRNGPPRPSRGCASSPGQFRLTCPSIRGQSIRAGGPCGRTSRFSNCPLHAGRIRGYAGTQPWRTLR